MTTFRLPDIGEGLHEAEIVAWHVGVGDHVVANQPLVSVETDKAVVEIPSPQAGRIAALHGAPGDVVAVGSPLVDFAEDARVDTGTVVGEVPSAAAPSPTRPRAEGGAGPVSLRATPAVRQLAGRLGVDLVEVTPTGPGGTITRADVEAHAAAAGRAGTAAEPLRGVRRAMAANMARAHAEVVPATVVDDADLGDWPPGTDVTLRLVRAVAAGCRAEPALNAWYLGPEAGRVLHPTVDLGVAVDTADGLFVPVLRDVGNRDADDLRRGLERMEADIRARTVAPEHLRGQTITLSNFGIFGGRYAALVVVPPQVAILGAGRARPQVVVHHGAPAVRPVLPLSLTFDHRVVTGSEATRFLTAVIADLETPT